MDNISNYFERCISLLANQFQIEVPNGSLTNFQKMLYAISTQSQLINNQEYLLNTQRNINTALGVQLDGLGQILGLPRIPGQSDQSYREDLAFQIFINSSSGTPEQMISILKYLTNATEIYYSDAFPAAYNLVTNAPASNFPPIPSDLSAQMQNLTVAGVDFIGVSATYGLMPFIFSSDPFDEQLYANPNALDISQSNPIQVFDGTNTDDLFVQIGQTSNPDFGGGFAEAIFISSGNYTYDNIGAGALVELLQVGGNIAPTY